MALNARENNENGTQVIRGGVTLGAGGGEKGCRSLNQGLPRINRIRRGLLDIGGEKACQGTLQRGTSQQRVEKEGVTVRDPGPLR